VVDLGFRGVDAANPNPGKFCTDMGFDRWRGAVAWVLGVLVQAPGLLAERWFFFAQAKHPQNFVLPGRVLRPIMTTNIATRTHTGTRLVSAASSVLPSSKFNRR